MNQGRQKKTKKTLEIHLFKRKKKNVRTHHENESDRF